MTHDVLLKKKKGTIVVVDDIHANLHLLAEILGQEGYNVRPVPNGALALSSIQTSPPDLVLLDIMMPEMDGYEVCIRLKSNPTTRDIPVIFISALHEIFDKVRAFKVGGVDYISKPFHPEEVLARVSTHLTLSRLQRHLVEQNAELQKEIHERENAESALSKLNAELEQHVSERTQALENALETLQKTQEQLIQSEKMGVLASLVAGIAHEINTPIGVGLTAASHLQEITHEFSNSYELHPLKRSELEAYVKTVTEASQMLVKNMHLAAERTQSFKEMAVDQVSGTMRRFYLKPYLNDIFLNLMPALKKVDCHITLTCPDTLEIESFPGAFSQIISNLTMNSLIHGFEQKTGGEIRLAVTCEPPFLVLTYSDNGTGMNPEQCARVFEAFYTTKRQQGGTGLGMNIVQNLVTRKLRGQIECQSIPDVLTTFTIRIPYPAEHEER